MKTSPKTIKAFRLAILAITVSLVLPGSAQPCSPHRATATASLSNPGTIYAGQRPNCSVIGATILDGGCGYTNPPVVVFEGGGGTGAAATAVLSNGVVVGLNITAGGSNYWPEPDIYIYSPQGLQTDLARAVRFSATDLLLGTNYQLEISGDLVNWTNQGAWFAASNTVLNTYVDVSSWDHLFCRVQPLTSSNAMAQVCIDNLRQIDDAIRQWRLQTGAGPYDAVMLSDITPYMKFLPVCPAGGTYITDSYQVTDAQTPPRCFSPGGGPAHGHVLSTNVPPPYP